MMIVMIGGLWLTGCNKQEPPAPEGQAGTQSGAPAGAAATGFMPPSVDLSQMPRGLQALVGKLSDAVRNSPDNPDPVGTLGAIYYIHNQPEAAVACFERARQLAGESLIWRYYLALALERKRDHQRAIKEYEAALELDSTYGPLYVRLARLLVDSDRQRVEQLCKRALELNPRNATAMLMMGLAAAAAKDYETARKHVQQALELDPQYAEAHLALARIYKETGQQDKVEAELQAARRGRSLLVDDDLFARLLRLGYHFETLLGDARNFIQQGAYEQAEKALQMAAAADPDGVGSLALLAELQVRQGRFEQAAETYRRLARLKPEATAPRLGLAGVLARLEKPDEAEAVYKDLLKSLPTDRQVVEAYSVFLMSQGRAEEAQKLWQSVLEKQPDAAWAHLGYGNVLANLGRAEQAAEQLNKALAIKPDDPEALWSLGLLARQAGDDQTALKHWQRIVEVAPGFVQAYVGLAETTWSHGQYEQAIAHARKGLEARPESPTLQNLLAWFLATCPNEKLRNGTESVKLAEAACRQTGHREHAMLDTLATAYAEAGRFDEAIKTAQQAIDRAAELKAAQLEDYRRRLELFKQHKPYHESTD